jgi:hypothetical protein
MIWALLGIWSLAAFFCPPRLAEAIAPYHFIPGWRWYFWVIGALIVAFFWVFESSYRHSRGLEEKLDGAPKLVCKGISFHKNAISGPELSGSPAVPTGNMVIIGTPMFYHLHIVNEPTGITDRKVAEKVAGRVQIFHENGTPAANERLHRWEDSPVPNDPQVGKMADSMIPRDISPSGVEYRLDIAMKYDDEDDFYTPNNETVFKEVYGWGRYGWREEEYTFPPGTYIAQIHLSGANVSKNLRCQIVNKGKGSELEITRLRSD